MLKKAKSMAQDYAAGLWERQDLNPGLPGSPGLPFIQTQIGTR